MPHFDARWQRPETLLAIFDQISDAVFFYDKNLHLIRVNKRGEQLFGMPAEQMIGKACWELFGFATGESNQDFEPQDLPPQDFQPGSGPSWYLPTGAVLLRMDHGRERRVIIRTIELLDEAGSLEGVVATVTDVTEGALPAGLDFIDGSLAAEPVNSGSRRPIHNRSHRLVLPKWSVASVAGLLLLLFITVLVAGRYLVPGIGKQLTPEEKRLALAEKEKREATDRFNAMTPAQHLERAKQALRPGATSDVIVDGLRHLKVIPSSAPESGRAKALLQDLTRAGNLANARSLIDTSSNGDLHDGMEKLQRANAILTAVAQQYPANKDAAQLSSAAQTAAEQLAVRFPQEFASAETKLVDFTWEKGGFGTVMMANFTIRNDSPVDVADLKIHCQHYAASGVVLDQNAGTAYVVVKAHSTTRIPNVNMGFLNAEAGNSRATKTDCEISSLKLAAESQALRSTR